MAQPALASCLGLLTRPQRLQARADVLQCSRVELKDRGSYSTVLLCVAATCSYRLQAYTSKPAKMAWLWASKCFRSAAK